ncbi:MAG: hypothetical protein HW420_1562 [Candidatus Nitrosotenuis sp.]|nr:hypothetical protein [Candidatus Nitrosotenuis sp.]
MDIMSKQQTTDNTKDVFAVYTQCFDKIQSNVERANPQFLQSITNLQQEYLAACGNFVHNVIASQQNYVNKIGINTSAPEATTKVVYGITDEIIKGFDVQSKMVHTALDATKQHIKAINENATSFAALNQNIINSWISMWNQKN